MPARMTRCRRRRQWPRAARPRRRPADRRRCAARPTSRPRAPAGEVEEPDHGEHHEHDPRPMRSGAGAPRLVVLARPRSRRRGRRRSRPGAGSRRTAARRSRSRPAGRRSAPAEHGVALSVEEAPDRAGEVGGEPEHREHADDDEPDGKASAPWPRAGAGGLPAPLPGGRRGARRSGGYDRRLSRLLDGAVRGRAWAFDSNTGLTRRTAG